MHTVESTMTMPLERVHDPTLPASGPPRARLLDTLVLLLAIGAVVVACGLVTVLVLHPFAGTVLAERAMAIVASW